MGALAKAAAAPVQTTSSAVIASLVRWSWSDKIESGQYHFERGKKQKNIAFCYVFALL
jgi:hypothetical protein